MFEWFSDLDTLQKVFAVFAVIGSLLFIMRLILMFIGLGDSDAHGDVDVGGADGDFHGYDGHGHAGHSADADVSFKLLSFQGLTAFFMMFGLVGLAMSKGSGFGPGVSIVAAIAAGSAMVWVIRQIFRFFSSLQHSGTLDLRSAIGQEGTVYLTIREKEPGKVRLTVQGHLKVMDAVSSEQTEIPTDTRVLVVNVINDNVLVVQRV